MYRVYKIAKVIRFRLLSLYNDIYFKVQKILIGNKVSFGKIIFYKGFVFDIGAKNFAINIGKVVFKENCTVRIRKNGKLVIGNGVFFNRGCSINCLQSIKIGDNSLFGENVKLYDHNHRFNENSKLINEQGYTLGNITVGNNCWIGSNVTILKNVSIGDNVVIGANCLVYKNIKSNSIVKHNQSIIIKNIE